MQAEHRHIGPCSNRRSYPDAHLARLLLKESFFLEPPLPSAETANTHRAASLGDLGVVNQRRIRESAWRHLLAQSFVLIAATKRALTCRVASSVLERAACFGLQ